MVRFSIIKWSIFHLTNTNYEQREYPKEFLDSLYENNNFTSANTEEDEMDLDM